MEDSEDLKKIDEAIEIEKHNLDVQECDEIDDEYAEFIDYDGVNDNPNERDELFGVENELSNALSCKNEANIAEVSLCSPSQFLTENEKQVVNACSDPLLKEILLLNRAKNIQLMQLYRKIKDLLVECQNNIVVNEERMNNTLSHQSRKPYSRVWRLGIPYFKTQDDFPSPRNPDVQRKHENGEFFFYEMTPSSKWSLREMNRLLKAVAFQYKVGRESELEKQIEQLKKNSTNDCKKSEVIQELCNKLKSIEEDETPFYPPVNCEKYLDWNRISKQFFDQKFAARECQIFWKTYLHPDINTSNWSTAENNRLRALASDNNYQNWDHIAKQLGNNRTGFVTCVHYYCTVSRPMIFGRFSTDEDKLLCDLVTHYRQGDYVPWAKVAHHFQGRTRAQLFYRYKYFLCCKENKFRGRFSKAEDILIMILVDRFGKKFSRCAEYFPHRSAVQIKSRYNSSLRGGMNKGSFTIDEDYLILDHVKQNGIKTWKFLVPILKRTGTQIRQRYFTIMSRQVDDRNADLKTVPRKRFAISSTQNEFEYMRGLADKFKNCERIPTIDEIQELLCSTSKPQLEFPDSLLNMPDWRKKVPIKEKCHTCKLSHHVENDTETSRIQNNSRIFCRTLPSLTVDDLLTDYFKKVVKSEFQKRLEINYVRRAASALTSILTVLQAELCIPKTYKTDVRLDAMDINILDVLKGDNRIASNDKFVIKRARLHIERMIPPNMNTLMGMRNLLIRNQLWKVKCNDSRKEAERQVLWCINTHLSSQAEDDRNEVLTERSLFYKRFVSLFKFPAVLSLVAPPETLCRDSVKKNVCNVIRTYERKRKPVPQQNQNFPVQPSPLENELIKRTRGRINHVEKATDSSRNKPETNNSKINPASNEMIITTKQSAPSSNSPLNSRQPATAQKPDAKLSIAEKMKQRISETLRDLTLCPPTKKRFFYGCPEVYPNLYCRNLSGQPRMDEGVAVSISTVVQNDIQVEQKGAKKYSSSKRKPEPAASAPIKTDKAKRAKITTTEEPTPNKNVITVVSAAEPTVSMQQNRPPSLGEEKLVIKNVPPGEGNSKNQDLCDVQLLNDILTNAENSDDEFFEF